MNTHTKKIGFFIATVAITLLASVSPTMAAGVTFTPWTYDPGNNCAESATVVNSTTVTLDKPCTTATNASAGASVNGVDGVSTTGLTLSFDYSGYCGAGAPRFNVYLSDGSTVFLGCTYGDPGNTGTATFTAGNTYGGVLFPTDKTVTGIDIVQDEQGSVTISNIQVNDTQAVLANLPTSKEQCKKDGYKDLTDKNGQTFKNQGQCVSYFNHL